MRDRKMLKIKFDTENSCSFQIKEWLIGVHEMNKRVVKYVSGDFKSFFQRQLL